MLLPFAAHVQTTLVTIRGLGCLFRERSAADRVADCHGAANLRAIRVAARSLRHVRLGAFAPDARRNNGRRVRRSQREGLLAAPR